MVAALNESDIICLLLCQLFICLLLPTDLGVEGRVAGHEEVEVGRRDERRDQADQVVVHVRWVPAKAIRWVYMSFAYAWEI